MQPRILQVRQQILKKNDTLARELRERFRAAGVFVVSLVSSPGAGKTEFLTETLRQLRPSHRVAAIVGDLATENDARRLATSGAPVRQIVTGTVCHLEAQMISDALADWDLGALDILFIENVGNLVCPSSYDLGEALRLVLLSTTEGEDKPLKYPTIFNTADLAVITKSDLAEAVEFDRRVAYQNIDDVRPGMPVMEVSARSGHGMRAWLDYVREQCSARFPIHRPSGVPPEGLEPALAAIPESSRGLCDRILGNIEDDAFSTARRSCELDPVELACQQCASRFLRTRSRAGRDVGFLLPLGVRLRHGDVLHADPRFLLFVSVTPSPVFVIRAAAQEDLLRLAYELGDLHCPVEIAAEGLIVPADDAIESFLARRGLKCTSESRRFDPHRPSATPPARLAKGFYINRG